MKGTITCKDKSDFSWLEAYDIMDIGQPHVTLLRFTKYCELYSE